jgi:hypothetical protein
LENSLEQLNNEVQLNEKNCIRVEGMKSEMHQRFLVFVTIAKAGYNDFDLYYDELGNRTSKMTNTFP